MMLRILLAIFILFHGIIHFLGFAKAFSLIEIPQLQRSIAKTVGIFWLLALLLFLLTFALILAQKTGWIYPAFTGIVISQILIFSSWSDAKYGTIANVIILLTLVITYGMFQFEQHFKADVAADLEKSQMTEIEMVTESDIQHLPPIVQKYLRTCQVINQPKVKNFKVVMEGEMRSKGKDFFPFESIQYNSVKNFSRFFFMKGKMFGMTVPGYHKYVHGKASMNIRLFGMIPIIKVDGDIMDQTETVTFFNDMCLMAPATLIDERISWKSISDTVVLATFTVMQHRISAELHFNQDGKLLNFISNDRTEISDMKKYPFQTPVHAYGTFDHFRLVSQGDGVWIYPDGAFIYGKFFLKDIKYNVVE